MQSWLHFQYVLLMKVATNDDPSSLIKPLLSLLLRAELTELRCHSWWRTQSISKGHWRTGEEDMKWDAPSISSNRVWCLPKSQEHAHTGFTYTSDFIKNKQNNNGFCHSKNSSGLEAQRAYIYIYIHTHTHTFIARTETPASLQDK